MNIPSRMEHSATQPVGSKLRTTWGVADLYLVSITLVAKLFCPFTGIPLLSDIARGRGIYCSDTDVMGLFVDFDHISFLWRHVCTSLRSFSNCQHLHGLVQIVNVFIELFLANTPELEHVNFLFWSRVFFTEWVFESTVVCNLLLQLHAFIFCANEFNEVRRLERGLLSKSFWGKSCSWRFSRHFVR